MEKIKKKQLNSRENLLICKKIGVLKVKSFGT